MNSVASHFSSSQAIALLSRLLLPPQNWHCLSSPVNVEMTRELRGLDRDGFDNLLSLAQSNHMIVRGLATIRSLMLECGDGERVQWAESAMAVEQARIDNALIFLHNVCAAFDEQGHAVTVIKSLDHWPDFGSDLDLYTNANEEDVFKLMTQRFDARVASQSWGETALRTSGTSTFQDCRRQLKYTLDAWDKLGSRTILRPHL
jgi:hypothetical protein